MKRSLKQIVCDGIKLLYNDIKAARWAIILIIAYFVCLKKYLYSLCPVVLFTGFPCPACGLTRAAFRVLHLDFAGAWQMHPFIYPIIFLAAWFCIQRYILQKNNMEAMKWYTIILIAGMIVFYIWRMYHYFPDIPPMGYFKYNIIYRIRRLLSLQ